MKNKLKRILPIVLAFTMLCGSVMTTQAKVSPEYCFQSGDQFDSHIVYEMAGTQTEFDYSFELTSGSDVYAVALDGNIDGSYYATTLLISTAGSFGFKRVGTTTSDLSARSLKYDGTTYYYHYWNGHSGGNIFTITEASLPIVHTTDFTESSLKTDSVRGSFFEYLCFSDVIYGSSGGPSFDDIMNDGKFKSNLGYLGNLKYKVRIGTKTSEMSHVVTWDNTHEDWDDSYRVAHYIQFTNRADTDPTLNEDHLDDAITSDLILMNDVKYSDCSSTYFIHGDKYQEESKKFKEYLESQLPFWEKDMAVFGSDQYLIIYRETENGTEYGYWNVLRTATSTGAAPEHEYGTMDDDGNFIEKENLGKVDTEVGRGDTLEDAEKEENNVKYDKDYDLDQIPTLDKASDLFEYFFELMDSLYNTIGDLPKVVGNLFTFLPAEMLALLSLGLLIAIILRIVGR